MTDDPYLPLDVIERAESAVYGYRGTDRQQARTFSELTIELINELKVTREQLQRMKERIYDRYSG